MEITQDVIVQNRIGCFNIPESKLLHPDIVAIMNCMVVIRCEHLFDIGVFEYVAYSNFFKSIPKVDYVGAPVYYFAKSKKSGDTVALLAGDDKGASVEYSSDGVEVEKKASA